MPIATEIGNPPLPVYLDLETVRNALLSRITPLPARRVSVWDSLGMVTAEAIHSSIHLPPFDSSAMDGYAVRVEDLVTTPGTLNLVGQTTAGEGPGPRLLPGQCQRIFTGAPLPPGADAVVMQEDVNVDPSNSRLIQFSESVRPWENVRFRGEDLAPGAVLVPSGIGLRPQHLAVLAACGLSDVPVRGQPQVTVLANGSELRSPGEALEPGQIYESNRLMLHTLLAGAGALSRTMPTVWDDLSDLTAALAQALEQSDMVVTVGGASVGDADLARKAVEALGGTVDFWRIAIRPGKPFFVGTIGTQWVLGLPGNPVSAFVTAILLVLPVLRRFQGLVDCLPPERPGELAEPLLNPGDRDHYARVIRSPDGRVRLAGQQASHRLASLAASNGLVRVPASGRLETGSKVQVIGWD